MSVGLFRATLAVGLTFLIIDDYSYCGLFTPTTSGLFTIVVGGEVDSSTGGTLSYIYLTLDLSICAGKSPRLTTENLLNSYFLCFLSLGDKIYKDGSIPKLPLFGGKTGKSMPLIC